MGYDADLAERIRHAVQGKPNLTEKRMFGGLAFFLHGNLAVSASGQGGLLVRIDPSCAESLVSEPLVRRMTMRGREMHGWLHVDNAALHDDEALRQWVRRGVEYARSLPPR